VPMADGSRAGTQSGPCMFERLGMTLELQEKRTLDIETDFVQLQGLGLTITTPDKARDLAVGKL
jgi:hypothetical protein